MTCERDAGRSRSERLPLFPARTWRLSRPVGWSARGHDETGRIGTGGLGSCPSVLGLSPSGTTRPDLGPAGALSASVEGRDRIRTTGRTGSLPHAVGFRSPVGWPGRAGGYSRPGTMPGPFGRVEDGPRHAEPPPFHEVTRHARQTPLRRPAPAQFAGAALSMIGAATAAGQEPRRGRPAPATGPASWASPALTRGGSSRSGIRSCSVTARRTATPSARPSIGGLTALTGTDHPVEAWRTFVQPGEAVGIKVVPNGYPGAHTSHELVLEVIAGLRSAGIKLKDMVVFDRYGLRIPRGPLSGDLARGRRLGGLDPGRLGSRPVGDQVRGQRPDRRLRPRRIRPVDARRPRAGPQGRPVLPLPPGPDRDTKRLDKIILLPCIKDHHAAGATGALKNMSHGLVNNVFRSHSSPSSRWSRSSPRWSAIRSSAGSASCTSWTASGASGRGAVRAAARVAVRLQRAAVRDRPGGDGPCGVGHPRRGAQEEGVPGVGAVGRLVADPSVAPGAAPLDRPEHLAQRGDRNHAQDRLAGLDQADRDGPERQMMDRFPVPSIGSIDHRRAPPPPPLPASAAYSSPVSRSSGNASPAAGESAARGRGRGR